MAELNLALTLKARDQASRVFQRAQSQIKQSTKAMASARETLGVRSEHKIQQEINHTIAAYNRLKRSGTATTFQSVIKIGRASSRERVSSPV